MTRPRRRQAIRLAIAGLTLTALAAGTVALLNWRADRRFREAAAEADRVDPHWRLDDLLAERTKLPDAENSAVRVEEIAARLPPGWPPRHEHDDPRLVWLDRPDQPLGPERLDELHARFDEVSAVAPAARALADFPNGQYDGARPRFPKEEFVPGRNVVRDVRFPFGEAVRRVVYLLWIDAGLRIEAGDSETALRDVRAMLNAGRSIGDYPGSSAQYTRLVARRYAILRLERLLARGEARAAALADLQALLEDEERHPAIRIIFRGDRAIDVDFLEQIIAGKLARDEIPYFARLPSFFRQAVDRLAVNRRSLRDNQASILRTFGAILEAIDRPPGERERRLEQVQQRLRDRLRRRNAWESARLLPEQVICYDTHHFEVLSRLVADDVELRTAIAALAAERYRLDHGHWPESLDRLVPDDLAAVPLDPFAPGPLKLRRLDDGLFVYSVGADRIDHGGKINWPYRLGDGADSGFLLRDADRRAAREE